MNQLINIKFVENYDDLVSKLNSRRALMVIFVDPSILTPSASMLKYLVNNVIGRELEQNIFAYKGVEAKMFEFFNVMSYPQVTVLKQKTHNVLYNFIGCNHQKASDALGVLAVALGHRKPHRKLRVDHQLCPNNHELKLTNQISETTYSNGFFVCNSCNMFSHVQIDKPILRCSLCQYDLCNNCSYMESMN